MTPRAEILALMAYADRLERLASQARTCAAELQAKLCLKTQKPPKPARVVPEFSTGRTAVRFVLGSKGWQMLSRRKAGKPVRLDRAAQPNRGGIVAWKTPCP